MPIPEAKYRPGDARQKGRKRLHYAGKTMAQLAPVVQKRGREKLLACKFILIFANTVSRFSLFMRNPNQLNTFRTRQDQLMQQELILIRITGEDRPGLTADFMAIMAKYEVDILDIGQADIHSTLSLGILIHTNEQTSGSVMKEVLFKAAERGVNVRFYPIEAEEYTEWVRAQEIGRAHV